MTASDNSKRRAAIAFAALLSGTTLGLAGVDLILPAIPSLPGALGGTATTAQLTLSAFVAGVAVGILSFGELGARLDQRRLLVASLAAYAALSLAAAFAPNLPALIGLRFLQGASSSAAAVFAPGIIRMLFDEKGAVRAIGLLGSIESLVPALAPLVGVWMLSVYGWRSSFFAIAALAGATALVITAIAKRLPTAAPPPESGASYLSLMRSPQFLRYALSQACTLGGLLVFVFGAPAVFTGPMEGSLRDFVALELCGISFFIVASNITGHLAERFGAERMIFGGSLLAATGALAILGYGLAGGGAPLVVIILFVPVNIGLGLRGPPGFYRAIVASNGNDGRASALVLMAIFGVTAAGSALAAPWVTTGLTPLAAIAAAISTGSFAALQLGAPLPDAKPASEPSGASL